MPLIYNENITWSFSSLHELDHLKHRAKTHCSVWKCCWSWTAHLSSVSLPDTENEPWSFPQGFPLNKAHTWLRRAGGDKLCWLIRCLVTFMARGDRQPKSKCGLCLHVSARLCSVHCITAVACYASHNDRQSFLYVDVLCVYVCVAADCSVCSAVTWTPSSCSRVSTTSAPCCCKVRGRTSWSWTAMRGKNQRTHGYKILVLNLIYLLCQLLKPAFPKPRKGTHDR